MSYPILDANIGLLCSLRADFPGFEQAGVVKATDEACVRLSEPQDDPLFYEVIQLRKGVPVFWEDHMRRLGDSLTSAANFEVDFEELRTAVVDLLDQSGVCFGNLKIVLTKNVQLIHFSETYYPTTDQFMSGVPTGILRWERVNPNVKQIFADYKSAVAEGFARSGPHGPFYELLLEDRDGLLTEGSRSNLFFTKDDVVFGAPEDRILKGITRKYVLEAIAAAGAELSDRCLTFEEIKAGDVDGAFLTASPIDVLPIRTIESFELPSESNQFLRKVQNAYQTQIHRDVEASRHLFEN